MPPANAASEAGRWFRYAREDLSSAAQVTEEEGIARHACWLAQQAAEKALKAVLIFHGVAFPKTHDLDLLVSMMPADCPIPDALPDLAELSEWAVESRYPGDWPEATLGDARSAVEQAQQVLHVARDYLAGEGLDLEQGG